MAQFVKIFGVVFQKAFQSRDCVANFLEAAERHQVHDRVSRNVTKDEIERVNEIVNCRQCQVSKGFHVGVAIPADVE